MEGPTQSLPIVPLEGRVSIEQRIARELRLLIGAGQVPEGTQLVGRDLAIRFGVSQTPVRASLSQLERDGFVVFGPTGRAFVRRLTREDFEEIYSARYGLEGLAARLGADVAGPAQADRMAEVLVGLRQAALAQDVESYLEGRWQFYGTCYRASGRTRLVADVERLYRRSERYNRLVLSTPDRFRESLGRYEDFYAACVAGDGLLAERIVQESLRWAVDRVAGTLPSESDG
ncbi:MAG: GntR family transcriptional regulator [Actinobacteria bacterium]|nr:GntR family transcriptional regulator [Actinomycetota bacterium]